MIRGYSDHAANERTFLAWVRTGIAVIAFGFVVEKFNLFVLTMATANLPQAGPRLDLEKLSGPFGRYDGVFLSLSDSPWYLSRLPALSASDGCLTIQPCTQPAASAPNWSSHWY